jgi:DNA-directed RNA polymerase specialized sigma24 family protein
MEQRKPKWREPAHAVQSEQLLASYYSQLLKWGVVLTRGDDAKAEDIVHEFCLYFTLTKPDLSGVANLDGYLYTCLRHIYLSGLARSSREAQHLISVAEFDSFEFALAANQSGDPLQRQNDLRSICGYAVWRKESSKTASYFIFHFFHGYSRREIAELARLPIAAIYNKLKIARTEVKSHLEEPGKLRIVNRDLPPAPELSWSLLPAAELFKELRETILHARYTECPSEEELLAQYRSSTPRPIDCSLLAHIVSCERCLAIIDQHFRRPTLKDREPLDGSDSSSDNSRTDIPGPGEMKQKAMLGSVRKRWDKVHEHRPRTLSIAVNGKIIALHDVQAEHSMLSVRIEHPERAEFIEVFSEQDVRLALLSVGDRPPEGSHTRTQRVSLSDSRWLELNLTFDGLGLNSQVAYFDPALALEVMENTDPVAVWLSKSNDPTPPSNVRHRPNASWIAAISRFLRPMVPSSTMAWALALTILVCATGYLAYRHANLPMDAKEILSQSVRIEAASLQGQTEHQVIRLEEVSADGKILQQGTVDLWKDGDDSRYVRRLYDSQHRLFAAKWRNKNGEHSSHGKRSDKDTSAAHRSVAIDELWDQDLSAHAFSALAGNTAQVHAAGGGYELTTAGPVAGGPQLISATLVLDHHFLPVSQIMRVRIGSGYHELRFVQAEYECKPSASVPDTLFDPENELHSAQGLRSSVQQESLPTVVGSELQLAQLQIAVLYQLNGLGADTGEPIEVVRASDGHIRVSGTVLDSSLKQEIISHLEALEDHQLLDLRLISPRDVHIQVSSAQQATPEGTSLYDVDQAKPEVDATLRNYFQAKGLSGERLDSAIKQYSRDALQHAQRALQHAYALDRLGSALSATELRSIGLSSQQRWTEMVNRHATDLEEQLHALHAQLAEISPQGEESPDTGERPIRIEGPAQFNQVADHLLHRTQDLNSDVGRLFTSNPVKVEQSDALLATTMKTIPLRQTEEIRRFAVELKTSAKSALEKPQNDEDDKGILEQPR